MKRTIALLLTTLLTIPALAERYNVATPGTGSIVVPITNVTTTGLLDAATAETFTYTCGCAAHGAAVTMGACDGSTACARDASTANYNCTIQATDIDNDYCKILIDVNTATNADHVLELFSADVLERVIVSNSGGTAVTFESTGGNGRGLVTAGNGSGHGQYNYSSGTGDGVRSQGAGNGHGQNNIGAGTGAGLVGTGGSTDGSGAVFLGDAGVYGTTAGGTGEGLVIGSLSQAGSAGKTALVILGGASTYNNAGGKGGTAISITAGVSHASATSWNPALSLVAPNGDVVSVTSSANNGDAISLTPNGTGFPINCGTAVCFNGAGIGAGLVRE